METLYFFNLENSFGFVIQSEKKRSENTFFSLSFTNDFTFCALVFGLQVRARVLDALELESQTVVSCHVGVGS